MEVQTENKMGTMPINKLLVNISLPMVVSMLVQALYNIVDSVFVAQIDEYALTAVSLAFPLQNFMIAVAAGTGVGVNALLSKRLGERRLDEANLAAGNSVFPIFIFVCRRIYRRSLHTEKSICLSARHAVSGFSGSFALSVFCRRPAVRFVR